MFFFFLGKRVCKHWIWRSVHAPATIQHRHARYLYWLKSNFHQRNGGRAARGPVDGSGKNEEFREDESHLDSYWFLEKRREKKSCKKNDFSTILLRKRSHLVDTKWWKNYSMPWKGKFMENLFHFNDFKPIFLIFFYFFLLYLLTADTR